MIASLRDLLDWMVSAIRSRTDLVLEKPASPSAIAGSARATTSPSIVENIPVRVE